MDKEIVLVVAACIKLFDRVLLAKRYSSTIPEIDDKWEFPGGRIDFGETPQDALRRELSEELDLRIKVGRLLHMQTNVYSNNIHYLVMFYLCTLISDETPITKIPNTIWVPISSFREYDTLPGAREAIRTLIS